MTHKQTSRQTHLFSIFKEAESRPDKIESTSNNVQVRKKQQHRRRACDLLASLKRFTGQTLGYLCAYFPYSKKQSPDQTRPSVGGQWFPSWLSVWIYEAMTPQCWRLVVKVLVVRLDIGVVIYEGITSQCGRSVVHVLVVRGDIRVVTYEAMTHQ